VKTWRSQGRKVLAGYEVPGISGNAAPLYYLQDELSRCDETS